MKLQTSLVWHLMHVYLEWTIRHAKLPFIAPCLFSFDIALCVVYVICLVRRTAILYTSRHRCTPAMTAKLVDLDARETFPILRYPKANSIVWHLMHVYLEWTIRHA